MTRLQYLAKQHGSTILLVIHNSYILDVANRIIAIEDICGDHLITLKYHRNSSSQQH